MKQILKTLTLLGIVGALFCTESSYASRKELVPGTINRYNYYFTREELIANLAQLQSSVGTVFGPLLSVAIVAQQNALNGGTGVFATGETVRMENPAPAVDPNIARQNEAARLANIARAEQAAQIEANEARRIQATAKYAVTSERAAVEREAAAERKLAEDAARATEAAAQAARKEALLEEGRQKAQAIEIAAKERSAKYKALMESWCVPGETLIAVADGVTKPIDSIQTGEYVLSCNPEVGVCEYRQVLRVFKSVADHLVTLSYGGLEIRATENHQFFVANTGWVEAAKLTIGDQLMQPSGESVAIESKADETGTFEVYNLEVEGNHTYYACDVLVHNCNPKAAVAVVGALAVEGVAVEGAALVAGGLVAGAPFGAAAVAMVATIGALAAVETIHNAMNEATVDAETLGEPSEVKDQEPKLLEQKSTGRNTPKDLTEQLAMEEVMANPAGKQAKGVKMGDPRFPAKDGWIKMEQDVGDVKVHYLKNIITGAITDFKFK